MKDSSSLRSRAASGFAWSFLERFGQQGVLFVVQLVLARLLAPEEFGLIAMVAVFIAISGAIIDCGFSRAIIQKKEVTNEDLSTVFYFNCLVSVALAFALWCLSPYIADFYEQPKLVSILRWLTVGLLFGAVSMVQVSILNKELKFKSLFASSFPSIIVSGVVGIAVALNGGGVWALVAQMLSEKFLCSIFLWFQVSWKPGFCFSGASLREMFPYGSRLALSSLLDQVFRNIYVLVIGKFFAPVDVGYFQRAKSFQQLPVGNFQSVLSRVAFPLFSSIKDDPVRMRRGMRKALLLGTMFAFPAMAGMAAVAEPLVVFLIGEKWLPIVPYLQLLCVVGALFPIHAINVNLLMAIGRADCFLRLEIIKKVLVIVNILITFRLGVTAMIYGMIVTSSIALAINTYYSRKFIDYGFRSQMRDVFPLALQSLVMFAFVYVVVSWLAPISPIELPVGIICGIAVIALSIRWLAQELKEEIDRGLSMLPVGARIARIIL